MFRHPKLAVLAVPLALFLTAPTATLAQCAQGETATQNCSDTGAAAPGLSAGQVIYLDAETGEVLKGEAAARAASEADRENFASDMAAQMRRNFNVQNLSEARTATGAVAVDLQGRFQSTVAAVIDPDKGLLVGHVNKEGRLD